MAIPLFIIPGNKMIKIASVLVLAFLFSSNNEIKASNILFFHLAGTASHRTSIWPLAEKLANKGHNVTYIFPLYKKVNTHPAIEEITPSKVVPILQENIEDYDINLRLNNSNHLIMQKAFSMCFDMCEAFYESPEIQEWMSRPGLHYDLVLIDSSMGECIYGVIHKLKAKHIIFVPAIVPYHLENYGTIPESSSIPETFKFLGRPSKPNEMGFFGRLSATLEPLMWRFGYLDYLNKVELLIKEKMNITDLPPLGEFERNTSLVLVNAHFVEDYPMSLPPLFQSYSGISCSKDTLKQRKPLPDNLAKFVDGKDSDGFVYISFGSAVSAANMPLDFRHRFFETISSFPKLKFLWRWTGPIPKDKPENLLLQKWFPQHDVLSHPKIKGFITQCGRPSSQEALCYGVPLVTIPVFADQDYNADRLEYIGAAINIDIAHMTLETLKNAIQQVAYNETMKTRVTQLSTMFKDRPIDPLDNAVYWTEYVLRHDTTLMKPLGIHQTWYQRRLLDVYLFIAVVLFSVISIVTISTFYAFKYLLKVVGVTSSKVTTKKHKAE